MAWWLLVFAGVLESVWAVGLPATKGFTRLWPSIGIGVAMVASFVLLAQAARTIPASTAYAVWVAIGVVGAFVGEALLDRTWPSAVRTLLVLVIAGAVVGLKLTAPKAAAVDDDARPADVTGTR